MHRAFISLFSAALFMFILSASTVPAASAKNDRAKTASEFALAVGSMQADMLEAVEEGFAYVLTGEEVEKTDFREKMRDFGVQAGRLSELIRSSGDTAGNMAETLNKVTKSAALLESSAEAMFKTYEASGKPARNEIKAFQTAADRLTGYWDEFLQADILRDLDAGRIGKDRSRASIYLVKMHIAALHAVEEAFSYLLLGDGRDKSGFFSNMETFRNNSERIRTLVLTQKIFCPDTALLFHEVLAAGELLTATAMALFAEYEDAGRAADSTLHDFEERVDVLTERFDVLGKAFIKMKKSK